MRPLPLAGKVGGGSLLQGLETLGEPRLVYASARRWKTAGFRPGPRDHSEAGAFGAQA